MWYYLKRIELICWFGLREFSRPLKSVLLIRTWPPTVAGTSAQPFTEDSAAVDCAGDERLELLLGDSSLDDVDRCFTYSSSAAARDLTSNWVDSMHWPCLCFPEFLFRVFSEFLSATLLDITNPKCSIGSMERCKICSFPNSPSLTLSPFPNAKDLIIIGSRKSPWKRPVPTTRIEVRALKSKCLFSLEQIEMSYKDWDKRLAKQSNNIWRHKHHHNDRQKCGCACLYDGPANCTKGVGYSFVRIEAPIGIFYTELANWNDLSFA